MKAVDRHWERIWHKELSHDGVNCLLASLSAFQPATWGHLQRFDHCQAVKIFCCNSVLTLLLPRFGLVASAAAVLGRWCSPHSGWSQTLLNNTNLPLGGAIKSRQAAVAIRLCLSIGRSPTSQAKDGTLSAIARVGRMGAETCCPKVHLRGGGWTELADQVIPSRRNALITTCWDGDTTNGRGTNLIACLG